MRAAERKKKRADARAAKRAKEGAANEGGAGDGDGDGDGESESDSDSDSDSVSAPASAKAELSRLIAALDADPALRAAAPADEVEGELLALQYELLWQSQANRHVLASTFVGWRTPPTRRASGTRRRRGNTRRRRRTCPKCARFDA